MDGVPDSNAGRCSSVVPDASAKRPVTLVHAAYPLWRKHTLVSLARAKELQDAGHDVTVSYCGSSAGTCAVNYSGNPVACQICQSRVTRTATELGLKTVALKTQESNPDQQTSLKYSEKQQLVEGDCFSPMTYRPGEWSRLPILLPARAWPEPPLMPCEVCWQT